VIEVARALVLPLWPVLAGCLALGLPFGALGWREAPAGFAGRLGIILAVVALVGAVALVVLGRVPGRGGLWLEIGLASVLAYLTGCVLGSVARRALERFRRRPEAAQPPA
jgi:hypothetical protein